MSAQQRRARREFVRRAHPDAGGDPEVFRLGMKAIEEAGNEKDRPSAAAGLAAKAADRAGRLARDWAKLPGQVKKAYRDGREDESVDEDS